MALAWYVVQTYSGFEHQVVRSLQEHVRRSGFADRFGEILAPTEKVVETREGKRRSSERKFFPGYVLVQMDMNDETWHLVKRVPKVLGFVGGTPDRPKPIREEEAMTILHRVQEGAEKPRSKIFFEVGETVRITEGPFHDFSGTVEEVNYDKSRLKVSVLIFDRSTPVELDFGQVEKI